MAKKTSVLIALLVLSVIAAIFLLSRANRGRQLNVLTWNDYVGEFTHRDFTANYNVTVSTKNYVSNEDAYALVSAQSGVYDIVVPSDYMIDRMIKEGRLEKIGDHVKNFTADIIDQRAIQEFRSNGWDQYCVPYLRGNAGFTVNKQRVNKPAREVSWRWLASDEFTGRLIVIDDPRQVLGSVLIELGHSANSIDPSQLAEAAALLRRIKSKIVEFTGDSIKSSAKSGKADVGFAWSGDALQLEGDMSGWNYSLPKAGGLRFQDGVCLVKDAPHKEIATRYLSFVLDPKVHSDIIRTTLYPTTNRAAREMASERYRAIERAASDDETQTQRLLHLEATGLDAIRKAWEEVKR